MKKLLALLLTLVMCLSLAACGGSGTDTSGTDTSSGETGEDSGDSSYRVAMICDSSISYCDLGYDLIYAPGNQYTDAVLQAAEEFPDVAFALLNGGEDTPAKAVNGNVTSLLPNAQQVGWIAGALAGLANGLFGGGGGMVFLPILSRRGDLSQRQLYATCVGVIFPVCLLSAAVYLFRGGVALTAALPYLAGGLLGGWLGGMLYGKVPTVWLRRIFAGFLFYAGVKYLL